MIRLSLGDKIQDSISGAVYVLCAELNKHGELTLAHVSGPDVWQRVKSTENTASRDVRKKLARRLRRG